GAGDGEVHALAEGLAGDAVAHRVDVAVHEGAVLADAGVVVGEPAIAADPVGEGVASGRGLARGADVLGADVAEGVDGVPRLALAAALVAAGDGAAHDQPGAPGHGGEPLAGRPGPGADA